MECTCPYAMDGMKCKHKAAVLFGIEENETTLLGEVSGDWKQIVEKMSESELRQLINDLVQ